MNARFDGRSAIVTGGTGGIGRAIAEGLANAGCQVVVTGLTAEEVSTFPAAKNLSAERLDVADSAAVAALAERHDQLDVLVNAAGIILREGREHTAEGFQQVIDVNLTGTMRACYACRPALARSRGCVLNIASMLSYFGSGHVPAYSSSKGGVAQLTKSLAIAWAAQGIRVNALAPGWIETVFTAPLRQDPARSRAILDRTPAGRWGRPEDLVGPALFLCSDAAAFITGAMLPVDGGYSIA